MRVWFVSCTRLSQSAFEHESMLARSLGRIIEFSPAVIAVAYENREPLARAYNQAIDLAEPDDILAFVHDDVWIDDWYVAHRLEDALATYDVIGVAGSRVRDPKQQSWAAAGATEAEHHAKLSGGVFHGTRESSVPSRFGTTPEAVVLLDGVFLASRAGTLRDRGVRFDPRFRFHFYDTDFCRSCEAAGLAMGTWPIAITHASYGQGGVGPEWDEAYRLYLEKWGR